MTDISAQRIKQRRKELGMSQDELAKKLGVERSTIGKWETGASNLKMSKVEEIAKVLNCSAIWLMGFEFNSSGQHINVDYMMDVLNGDDGSIIVESVEHIEQAMASLDIKSLERLKAYIDYLIICRKNKSED